jgi:hypothetical protein
MGWTGMGEYDSLNKRRLSDLAGVSGTLEHQPHSIQSNGILRRNQGIKVHSIFVLADFSEKSSAWFVEMPRVRVKEKWKDRRGTLWRFFKSRHSEAANSCKRLWW